MTLEERPSPKGKSVSLFVTCMVDMLYPDTGFSVLEVLRHLEVTFDFPAAQTCCGQPAFNGGFQDEARQVAQHFLKTFKDAEVIVTPSGSCAAMVRHEYPRLFADDPVLAEEAQRLGNLTWEFTEFVVDGLGISDLGARLPEPRAIAFHHACHGLRMLGLGEAGEILISKMENATVEAWDSADTCCGFGGFFSVKMPEVSGAMMDLKLGDITASGADWIATGDVSCLTHMNHGLEKQAKRPTVRHIADILAEGLRDDS